MRHQIFGLFWTLYLYMYELYIVWISRKWNQTPTFVICYWLFFSKKMYTKFSNVLEHMDTMTYISYMIYILPTVIIDTNSTANYLLALCTRDKTLLLNRNFGACLLNNNFCHAFENKEHFISSYKLKGKNIPSSFKWCQTLYTSNQVS